MVKVDGMKTSIIIATLVFLFGTASAQLKTQIDGQQSISNALIRPLSAESFTGLFDPNRFSMRHSFSLGYVSGGGNGLSLASYTNSMNYKLADPLDVRMDITLQGSPFGSYGSPTQNNLSKLFISNAQMNYRMGDNMRIQFQYQQLPYSQWLMNDPFSPYRSSMFFGDR